LALEAEADGVHVGPDDVSATACRKLLGKDAIVGLSTHATLELDNSLKEPVNYISAGPVVATPTKPGRNGTGIDYIRYAASHSCIPVFVTGGVTPESIPELIANGVKHFVVVRYLTESEDPQKNAAKLRTTIDEGLKNLG
jgi:thiamine-phosphate pyrophosphorylase